MPEPSVLLWYIPGLPLLGAIVCLLFGKYLGRCAALPVILGAVLSFAASVSTAIEVQTRGVAPPVAISAGGPGAGAAPIDRKGRVTTEDRGPTVVVGGSGTLTWIDLGDFQVPLVLSADPLTCIMLIVITFIGTWIFVFAVGYMDHHGHLDPGYIRFFALVGLFLTAMTLLVLADNFILMFAGWEGVGVCSYLLVGYWYYKPAAAAAARKAFLVTRLGDVGLILGIMLLWSATDYSLTFDAVFDRAQALATTRPGLLTASLLLILCGCFGKSAQFPLYVWLPDAMEGPTPVSALIHAATMVTAGVYLIARCIPIFALVPEVQIFITLTGGVTALIAAFIALTQTDLKRVLAYSTVSQLGYMFMALGTAGAISPTFAVTAAVFHLFTHAFFKAVLFLSAGSVMHSMGDVIDMRRFSGLRKVLPITHLTFLAGSLALAGLPLLSGFWSKDMILEALLKSGEDAPKFAKLYWFVFGVAILTAGMTAFYTFRAYFRTFWGPKRLPEEAGDHPHESPLVMTLPLLVLGAGALVAGAVAEPITGFFGHFLEKSTVLQAAEARSKLPAIDHALNWSLAIGSSLVALAGVLLAAFMYASGARNAPLADGAVPKARGRFYYLSLNKLYVDEMFTVLFVKPLTGLAWAARAAENLVYDLVRLVSFVPKFVGSVLAPMQNGLVQFYALSMMVGVVALVSYLVLFASR